MNAPGAQIGTLTYSVGSNIGVFSSSSRVRIMQGDIVQIVSPSDTRNMQQLIATIRGTV